MADMSSEQMQMDRETLNRITHEIIGAAIEVHRVLGPGLLESAYRACLAYELQQRGLKVEQEKPVPLVYKEVRLECGYRMDLLVANRVIVELKSVESQLPIHASQLHSHLKLADLRAGLLINFNVTVLKKGITRIVNDF